MRQEESVIFYSTKKFLVPETFRICRSLLNRLDDPDTGKVIDELQVEIPEQRIEQTKVCFS